MRVLAVMPVPFSHLSFLASLGYKINMKPRYETIPQVYFTQYPKLELMLRLIRIAHGNQVYNNAPYWHHPVRVLLRMNWASLDEDDVYTALGHDLNEDTHLGPDDLTFFGFNGRVVGGIKQLSRSKDNDQTYKEYIQNLIRIGDFGLLHVKFSDMYENSNNVRFLPMEKRKILVRYGKSIKEVQDFLSQSQRGKEILQHTISGELDRSTLEAWIGQEPTFL